MERDKLVLVMECPGCGEMVDANISYKGDVAHLNGTCEECGMEIDEDADDDAFDKFENIA